MRNSTALTTITESRRRRRGRVVIRNGKPRMTAEEEVTWGPIADHLEGLRREARKLLADQRRMHRQVDAVLRRSRRIPTGSCS